RRAEHRERILRDLDFCMRDNCQAWELKADGRYVRVDRGNERPINAQAELLAVYAVGPPATV
ncbi:MAG: hypothetical protein JO173_08215, partial [Gammaproteobacteria bacterium]|nr:hypothetical protein [Gammaproteobacteria bacterium]